VLNGIKLFMESKGRSIEELSDGLISALAFLVDMTGHIN
jgi:hypothetical protein